MTPRPPLPKRSIAPTLASSRSSGWMAIRPSADTAATFPRSEVSVESAMAIDAHAARDIGDGVERTPGASSAAEAAVA